MSPSAMWTLSTASVDRSTVRASAMTTSAAGSAPSAAVAASTTAMAAPDTRAEEKVNFNAPRTTSSSSRARAGERSPAMPPPVTMRTSPTMPVVAMTTPNVAGVTARARRAKSTACRPALTTRDTSSTTN